MHADIEEIPLIPLGRFLLWKRYWATSFLAMAVGYFLKMGPRVTNAAAEIIQPQTELSMLISVLYDTFSRMHRAEQRRAQNQLTALMIVATGDTDLKRKLNSCWRALRVSAGDIHGREWLEKITSKDKHLQKGFSLVMDILRTEGLIAVYCNANESLASPGGLAFAGAAAQIGDTVALVSGVSFPLVLRPCQGGQGRFKLVGPLFLPGVMDGELKHGVRTTPLNEIILV